LCGIVYHMRGKIAIGNMHFDISFGDDKRKNMKSVSVIITLKPSSSSQIPCWYFKQ